MIRSQPCIFYHIFTHRRADYFHQAIVDPGVIHHQLWFIGHFTQAPRRGRSLAHWQRDELTLPAWAVGLRCLRPKLGKQLTCWKEKIGDDIIDKYGWLWMIMDDYGWLWMIDGWLWMIMDDYGWLWMIKGWYGWLWMIMDDYGWLWMIMDDYGWLMDDYGWIWMIMDDYGWLWMIMDDYGWLWMIMDDYGWLWMIMDDMDDYGLIMDDYGWLWMIVDDYGWLWMIDDWLYIEDIDIDYYGCFQWRCSQWKGKIFLGSLGPFLPNVIDGGPKWRQEN